MTREFSLNLTPRARADLRTILRTSHVAWGDVHRYPQLGRSGVELHPGLRAHAVGRHVIYYLVDAPVIRVARILHVRMDAAAQFDLNRELPNDCRSA